MGSDMNQSEWVLDCWSKLTSRETRSEVKIIKEVATADWSECYETDAAHVFELDNGKFLFVTESGCSCYSSDDADLTVVDTEAQAMDLFNQVRGSRENS